MTFIDRNDGRTYTARDIFIDWKQARTEDPDNTIPTFTAEALEVIRCAIAGRNDLDVIGPTPRELDRIVHRLRARTR